MSDFSMVISNTLTPNTVVASAPLNTNFQTDIRDKFNAAINGSTGHTHDGTTGNGAPIVLQNASPSSTRQLGSSGGILQVHDGSVVRTYSTRDGTETLSGKTLTAPVLGGTVTGTYTLGGTPTISSPILSGTTTGTYTLGGTPTISSPALSGTVTGTYTLGGTPTITAPVLSGTATGTYTLGGTPTISSPVLSGTVTGTYTLGGTPTISSPVLSGTTTGTYTLGGTPTISSPTLSGTVNVTGTASFSNPALFPDTSSPSANYMARRSYFKAWAYFEGATGNLLAGFNVTSVTRLGSGNYQVNLTTAMASTNYACLATLFDNSYQRLVYAIPNTTSVVNVTVFPASGGFISVDAGYVHVGILGVQ